MNKKNAINTIGRITVCIVLVAGTLTLLNSRPLNAKSCTDCKGLNGESKYACEDKCTN